MLVRPEPTDPKLFPVVDPLPWLLPCLLCSELVLLLLLLLLPPPNPNQDPNEPLLVVALDPEEGLPLAELLPDVGSLLEPRLELEEPEVPEEPEELEEPKKGKPLEFVNGLDELDPLDPRFDPRPDELAPVAPNLFDETPDELGLLDADDPNGEPNGDAGLFKPNSGDPRLGFDPVDPKEDPCPLDACLFNPEEPRPGLDTVEPKGEPKFEDPSPVDAGLLKPEPVEPRFGFEPTDPKGDPMLEDLEVDPPV